MKKVIASLLIFCSFLSQTSVADDDMPLLSKQEIEECSAIEWELDHCAYLKIVFGSKVDCEKVAKKKFRLWGDFDEAKYLRNLCLRACQDPGDYVMNVKELIGSCKFRYQKK